MRLGPTGYSGMKIVFINPYCLDQRIIDYDIRVPPIGIYYLAAVLKERGHECHILNWYDMKDRKEVMADGLKTIGPDIVCISTLHANRWGAVEIAGIAKSLFRDVPTILGGPGATFLWKLLLEQFPQVDYIVRGEGEFSLMELVDLLGDGVTIDGLRRIRGICFRKGKDIVANEPMPFVEDLDILPDPSKYFVFQHVISSRGCPWHCSFCGSPRIWQRRVRFHSPEYFVTQLKRLREQGIDFFYVSDDTFTLRKGRVIEICKRIIDEGLDMTWVAISRVNIVDEEILYWMRLAGCIQISYGVESGSSKIRKQLNKEISDQEILKAFELTRSYGIMPRAYFIYGNPGETSETIGETIRLIKRIKPLSAIFYILDIFPGTELYEDFKKRTGTQDSIWLRKMEDIMYFETDDSLTEKDIIRFGKRLREAFFSKLPDFALETRLVNSKELARHHADFFSRLGMTFAFGDYAKNPMIPDNLNTAIRLFVRSLEYFPDHRAYLGLGMLYQRTGMHEEAIKVLEAGRKHYPDSEQIAMCLGVSLMNKGAYEDALNAMLPFATTARNIEYALKCATLLGDDKLQKELRDRLMVIKMQQVQGQEQ